MSPEARLLAVALLAHQREIRKRFDASTGNPEPFILSYSELCERAGVPELKPRIGKFLREIAIWCDGHGWPPLNAMAVNHLTRKPGPGYHSAPNCSLEDWPAQLAACVSFSDYPEDVTNEENAPVRNQTVVTSESRPSIPK